MCTNQTKIISNGTLKWVSQLIELRNIPEVLLYEILEFAGGVIIKPVATARRLEMQMCMSEISPILYPRVLSCDNVCYFAVVYIRNDTQCIVKYITPAGAKMPIQYCLKNVNSRGPDGTCFGRIVRTTNVW
jgi:hypothetical protein